MSVNFDPRKRIYDLYSFDFPYDLEPRGFSDSLRAYQKDQDTARNSTAVAARDDEDEFENLDLTLEEAERDRHVPACEPGPLFRQGDSDRQSSVSPALGATLSQRKKLLKERIEELVADIGKREGLEEQMLEKAELETSGLEFLLGQVKTWSLGSYPSVDMRRTNLEREILTLKKEGWDERLRCWKDVVALKKDLREVLEEYHLVLAAEGL
jgi:hypothetical protein